MTYSLFPSQFHEAIFSDGWRKPEGGTVDVTEPATGAVLGRIGLSSRVDVDRAVSSAVSAQPKWQEIPFDRRAAVMRKAASLLEQSAGKFIEWNVRECGSTTEKAQWELAVSCDQLLVAAGSTMLPDGELYPSSVPGRLNMCRRVPHGVVGVIAPWNFPLVLAIRSLAPALALGNAVVLKPDSQSAVTGGLLIAELFESAGLPEGVLHVLPGGVEAGDALVRHPDVSMISFTGSTQVGRAIGEICGAALKKVSLELGGNNAIVVFEDADVDAASSNGAWGSFLHQGQICMQTGRHLVHRSIAEQYTRRLVERAQALTVGDPHAARVHLGPLINAKQLARIESVVARSVDAGATKLCGGWTEGLFYAPVVLSDVRPGMPAFTEEVFGPIAPVTVFDSDEEALALVNSSPYGLSAAIHTASIGRGLAFAGRLKTGMVHINDQTVINEAHVPFGGMGASGNGGRFGGPANLHEFTQTQLVSVREKAFSYPF